MKPVQGTTDHRVNLHTYKERIFNLAEEPGADT